MPKVAIKCLQPRPMATRRLLLIPFAGGGATIFRHWADAFPADIEVFALQLPGREERIDEAPFTNWPAMFDACADALLRWPQLPIALYGHSLGAVIALELARLFDNERPAQLSHLFCAARPWPGEPHAAELASIESLDDDGFLQAMRERYGELHPSLKINEIRELTLPSLRADLKLLNSYNYATAQPINCPLTVYSGAHDPITTNTNLDSWRQETGNQFSHLSFDGGHFFLESHQSELTQDMISKLTA
ncbi:thioesterase II family protein [Hyphococcus sp. DH-69]|uniref:thioesterase II family protein n=1 Tax=Hyphococcus formosus TaxID=3143534 RepID=UPI00398BB96F